KCHRYAGRPTSLRHQPPFDARELAGDGPGRHPRQHRASRPQGPARGAAANCSRGAVALQGEAIDAAASIEMDCFVAPLLAMTKVFFPSPLMGEGGADVVRDGRGMFSASSPVETTPHPASLCEATLSHKGRG